MSKKIKRKDLSNMVGDMIKTEKVDERLSTASKSKIDKTYKTLGSSEKGKT